MSTTFIPTERSLNYSLFPVGYQGKKPKFPVKINGTAFYNNVNSKTFMFFDILALKVRYTWKKNGYFIDEPYKYLLKKHSNGMYYVRFEYHDIYANIPFLFDFSPAELYKIAKQSEVELENFEYYVRVKKRNRNKFKYVQHLFTNKTQLLKVTDKTKDYLEISLPDNNFARFFISNVVLKNVEYYPSILYKLDNATQMFYRKVLMPKWRCEDMEISRENIKSFLNLTNPNPSDVDRFTSRCLNRLVENNFVNYYKVTSKYRKRIFKINKPLFRDLNI